MRFFGRKKEIELLQKIQTLSNGSARFTVITGRRRIGKTSLVMEAYRPENVIYLFVSRKSERELCYGFQKEIQAKTGIDTLGRAERFADIFEYLIKLSFEKNITVFIDEFQDFFLVNPSVFSDMQKIWDIYKTRSKINLIVGGSVNSLMNRIFRDKKEPLFQRETDMIKLRPFRPSLLKEIISEYYPSYTHDDLLALYAFTGGVAKYVELLIDSGAYNREDIINCMVRDGSVFVDEGKVMLIGEFGKEYGTYFSILTAIARGRNTRAQIEDVTGREIGGYLTKLEHDYELIAKRQPVFEKTGNKNVRYALCDNFLIFWFRFIFKYNYMLEISAFRQLREIINRDYEVFSGLMLERYFREIMIEQEKYTRIGGWWNRKGENEIDIVAIDDINETAEIIEVKRNSDKIDLNILKDKATVMFESARELNGYKIDLKGLSLADM